jgi:acetylornithine deacetylase
MDPIRLARDLCSIPSVTGEEGPVVDFMADLLARLGYRVRRQPVTPGRDVVYALLDDPTVVLSTHLDVVPPHLPLAEDAEWLYGRGACDAKGIAAAMVAAAERLRAAGERRIGLLFVVGEEAGSDGARACALLEPKGRYLINGEPTENKLSIGQKGALCLGLTARGVAAHSAYPEEGRSAIDALLDLLDRIRALSLPVDPVLGATTLNIGQIAGGVAANVIPPSASATLLFRTVADAAELEATVRRLAGDDVAVEHRFEFRPVRSRPLPGWDTTTVKFASDLAHLDAWGEGYQMGPGSIRVAHTAEERILKRDIEEGVARYVRLANALLGVSD